MTKLLEKAFNEASKLPLEEQDSLARLLLAELASERQWSEAFAKAQNAPAKLADQAHERFVNSQTAGRSRETFRQLPREVQESTRKAHRLWMQNPQHPSLHFKRIHSKKPIYTVRAALAW